MSNELWWKKYGYPEIMWINKHKIVYSKEKSNEIDIHKTGLHLSLLFCLTIIDGSSFDGIVTKNPVIDMEPFSKFNVALLELCSFNDGHKLVLDCRKARAYYLYYQDQIMDGSWG